MALALLALTLPAATLAAQRRMIPVGRKTPERPAEKPPLMPGVHDSRMYSRYMLSRFSAGQYPMVSYFQTNGFVAAGIPASYWTVGDGTHLSFRATPSLFVTTDFTSSMLGGPFAMGSTDFGIRVKPWTAPRVTPFVDARMSWAYTSNAAASSAVVPLLFLYRSMYGDFTSGSGRGVAGAIGAEARLKARLFLTSAVSHSAYAMTAHDLQRRSGEWDYSLRATRLTVGLRYNHGRWLDAP
jgi:hypothetical protein